MFQSRFIPFFLLINLLVVTTASANSVEFNYNGFVRVQGHPFDGIGFFKFAIVNRTGSTTFWSNDGTTFTGDEPTSFVTIQVSAGTFSVDIGDTELGGMAALDPTAFNIEDRVFLRVWFNDGVHGFERLHPDNRIVNPGLLGMSSEQEISLFVDPAIGSDSNPGTTPAHPLKTIQAAWDALPPFIQSNVTIHLADGVYRESTFFNTKSIAGDFHITIDGNETSPGNVRVTGAGAGQETSPVLRDGFVVVEQNRLIISGILFDQFVNSGIDLENESNVQIRDCKFDHNRFGVLTNRATLTLENCEIMNGYEAEGISVGLHMNRFSSAKVIDCHFHGVYIGATAQQVSLFEIIKGTTSSNNAVGFQITQCSNMMFGAPNSTIANNGTAIIGGQNSSITYSETYVNFSGNTTKYDLRTGTQMWPAAM